MIGWVVGVVPSSVLRRTLTCFDAAAFKASASLSSRSEPPLPANSCQLSSSMVKRCGWPWPARPLGRCQSFFFFSALVEAAPKISLSNWAASVSGFRPEPSRYFLIAALPASPNLSLTDCKMVFRSFVSVPE